METALQLAMNRGRRSFEMDARNMGIKFLLVRSQKEKRTEENDYILESI